MLAGWISDSGTWNSPASIQPSATAADSSWLGRTPGVDPSRSASRSSSATLPIMPLSRGRIAVQQERAGGAADQLALAVAHRRLGERHLLRHARDLAAERIGG